MVGLPKSHLLVGALCWAATSSLATSLPPLSKNHHSNAEFKCDLPPPLDPASDGLPAAVDVLASDDALKLQVYRHSEIVKVPTISYDDNGEPGEDPRWEVFYKLHDVLERLYPKFHAAATKETVNTFGLVYTLKGTDASLKPLMLTAHQDVVPIADASTWKYPPFSAHFDGQWLWGRGASDDKNSLTGLFSALETLLDQPGWTPKRDIVLALGFDEECSGRRGAAHINQILLERYGPNSMAFLLDEGGLGMKTIGNVLYALPSVMEKGHVDVWLDLSVAGGHSSMPFPHTGIGIAAALVSALESHPYTPRIIPQSPVHNHMVCQARYSPLADEEVTRLVRRAESGGDSDAATALEELARLLAGKDRATQYSVQTSQSVDIFEGGVKINAMPEKVRVGVNHRIAPHDDVRVVKRNVLRRIRPVVDKFGIRVVAFPGEEDGFEAGSGVEDWDEGVLLNPAVAAADDHDISGLQPPLPPPRLMYEVDYNATLTLTTTQSTKVAPVSPTTGDVWDIFSGTVRYTFAFDNGTVVPVGEIMTGNTDTRHYLDLTNHVYRWVPTREGHRINPHTVDERIDMVGSHMETVRFYYDLIRNFDAARVALVDGAAGLSRGSEEFGEL